jgi:hypothetical protein
MTPKDWAYTALEPATRRAEAEERATGERRYVVRSTPDNGERWFYEVVSRMPLVGEWYDSHGIRHG